jgi:hypothetical protein
MANKLITETATETALGLNDFRSHSREQAHKGTNDRHSVFNMDSQAIPKGVTMSIHFQQVLQKMKDDGTYRVFNHIDRKAGNFPRADNRLDLRPSHLGNQSFSPRDVQKDITVWCNNDYLGMGQNPHVINAMKNILDKYGAGSGGTRNISGIPSIIFF